MTPQLRDVDRHTVEQRLEHRIVDGDRDGLEADLDEQLATRPALSIINDVLLSGMKTVGQLFASGEMQLPFVLQSAETMKNAVAVPSSVKLKRNGDAMSTSANR